MNALSASRKVRIGILYIITTWAVWHCLYVLPGNGMQAHAALGAHVNAKDETRHLCLRQIVSKAIIALSSVQAALPKRTANGLIAATTQGNGPAAKFHWTLFPPSAMALIVSIRGKSNAIVLSRHEGEGIGSRQKYYQYAKKRVHAQGRECPLGMTSWTVGVNLMHFNMAPSDPRQRFPQKTRAAGGKR